MVHCHEPPVSEKRDMKERPSSGPWKFPDVVASETSPPSLDRLQSAVEPVFRFGCRGSSASSFPPSKSVPAQFEPSDRQWTLVLPAHPSFGNSSARRFEGQPTNAVAFSSLPIMGQVGRRAALVLCINSHKSFICSVLVGRRPLCIS